MGHGEIREHSKDQTKGTSRGRSRVTLSSCAVNSSTRGVIAVCSSADVRWGGRRAVLSSSITLMLLSALQRRFMRVHQLLLQAEEPILRALFYILGLYFGPHMLPFPPMKEGNE